MSDDGTVVMTRELLEKAFSEMDKHDYGNRTYHKIYMCPVCGEVTYSLAHHLSSCSDSEHQVFKVLNT